MNNEKEYTSTNINNRYDSIQVPHSEESNPLLTNESSKTINQYNDNSQVSMIDTSETTTRCTSSFIDKINAISGEGTITQSVVIGSVISCVCGIASYAYYTSLYFLLEYIWHVFPERYIVGVFPEKLLFLWIPIVVCIMAICVGGSVLYLGEPGDLAYTVKCVHGKAFIGMDHVLPMLAASQFSILGGGSLGPEAPLVAICASLAGFVSRHIFNQRNRNVVRKHTLMGMAGALSAFFGCPLGGSLFALEVNSQFGVEYFEHTIEAIFCGTLTLGVFRVLAGMTIHPIWNITLQPLEFCDMKIVGIGAIIGLLGAGVAFLFTIFHSFLIHRFDIAGLLEIDKPIYRALCSAFAISTIGIFIPHTLFWGEFEFEQIANASPASNLTHVFPTQGLLSFQMDSCINSFLVGVFKIIAISFTVAGGYRGGFIFPFFAAGAAFGRSLLFIFPSLPPSIVILCFAAGINVAITKTCLSTTIILTQLAGEGNAQAPILAASIVSLFATAKMPFIKTQIHREDLDQSLHSRFRTINEESSLAGKKGSILRTFLSTSPSNINATSTEREDDNENDDDSNLRDKDECTSSLRKLSVGSYIN